MKQSLYLECYSGISGDMTVAALLDLGADEQVLRKALESLPLEGYSIEIKRVSKAGIDACDFNVVLEEGYDNHDHDMEYLHGHDSACDGNAGHTHSHSHVEELGHTHSHSHTEESGRHHHHFHRGLPEIKQIIEASGMNEHSKELANSIFKVLAEAEAEAHGTPLEQVHFHEVGAVDSIVDICAAAVCIDNLGIENIIVTGLYEGIGTVRCQHGILPVPVPAVAAIISKYNIPMHFTNVRGEFVTPTGAAIAAALATSYVMPETFTVKKLGVGAGKRNYEIPSMVRAMVIEEAKETEYIYKLESNVDDCTGEALGFLMDKLMRAGAMDVHYTPVFMKKNRPAYQLNVICLEADIKKLEDMIFTGTTTIGIRRQKMERSVLNRRLDVRQTSLGEVAVKVVQLNEGIRVYPEYDSLVKICEDKGLSYMEAYQKVIEEV